MHEPIWIVVTKALIDLVHHIAWPTTTIFVVVYFRMEIKMLLSRLIHAKIFGQEVELGTGTEQLERDKRFEQISDLQQRTITSKITLSPQQLPDNPLKEKARQLGHDLFAFLREQGPDPEVTFTDSMTLAEKLRHTMKIRGPYVEAIHYGYQRIKQRVIDLVNELAEHGIHLPNIEQWEIDPPEVQNASRIRKIAETLLIVAANMDVTDASEGI